MFSVGDQIWPNSGVGGHIWANAKGGSQIWPNVKGRAQIWTNVKMVGVQCRTSNQWAPSPIIMISAYSMWYSHQPIRDFGCVILKGLFSYLMLVQTRQHKCYYNC